MSDFAQPHDIDRATEAFPVGIHKLMPDYNELPKEYTRHGDTWGARLFNDWFYAGIESMDGLVPREGIDKAKALRHIRTVMGSWEPKHEHKEAAVAYLFEKWFDGEKSKWTRRAARSGT